MKYKSKAHKRASSYSKSRSKLSTMRDEMRELVETANRLVSQLKAAGGTVSDNAALAEAEASLTKSKERTSTELFSVDDKHRYRELRREAARLEKFLSSPQSSVDVYLHEKPAINAMNKYNLDFKRQHENFLSSGKRFGANDDERFKLAARIYRELESTNANIYGTGGYGSNNLINLLYDELEGYSPYMSENAIDRIHTKVKDIGQAALTEHQRMYSQGLFSGSPYQNIDIGIISKVRDSMSAEEFFEKYGDNLS